MYAKVVQDFGILMALFLSQSGCVAALKIN